MSIVLKSSSEKPKSGGVSKFTYSDSVACLLISCSTKVLFPQRRIPVMMSAYWGNCKSKVASR